MACSSESEVDRGEIAVVALAGAVEPRLGLDRELDVRARPESHRGDQELLRRRIRPDAEVLRGRAVPEHADEPRVDRVIALDEPRVRVDRFAGSARIVVVLPHVESEDIEIASPPVELYAGDTEGVGGFAVGRDVDDARSRTATDRQRAARIDVRGLAHIGEGSHSDRIVSPELEVLGELSAA